ncbi:MAG: SDR family NAD(P)-dependent oxidoreductase [Thermodesulfobacteriota bacterium]
MKSISILGSGWLGFPLSEHFVSIGYHVNASTRSEGRIPELTSIKVHPFIIDVDILSPDIKEFLQADILIINVPSKNIDGFSNLIKEIENSKIDKVLFVSSTSVYENKNKTISESDGEESKLSPLLIIENLFRKSGKFKTTIVRFGGLIGGNRNPGKLFSRKRLVKNPDSYLNLIHRDDCINIISRIIEAEVWGEIFNCCADTHPTRRELYTQAAKTIRGVTPRFADSGLKSFKIISNKKVKQFLNYEFLHPDLMKIKFEP